MRRRQFFASALAAAAHPAAARCAPLGDVPMRVADGRLSVPVSVNGTVETFIVDTGAERSIVSQALVQSAKLPLDPWVTSRLTGVDGTATYRHATIRAMSLGRVPLHRRALAGVGSLAIVPTLTVRLTGQTAAGLLGLDLLDAYDVDLDCAGGRLRLFAPRAGAACIHGDNVPATRPRGALVVPLGVRGTTLPAILDTGSDRVILSVRYAEHAGAPRIGRTHISGIKGLVLPGETVLLPNATLGPIRLGTLTASVADLAPGIGALLGLNVFATSRLMLNFADPSLTVA